MNCEACAICSCHTPHVAFPKSTRHNAHRNRGDPSAPNVVFFLRYVPHRRTAYRTFSEFLQKLVVAVKSRGGAPKSSGNYMAVQYAMSNFVGTFASTIDKDTSRNDTTVELESF